MYAFEIKQKNLLLLEFMTQELKSESCPKPDPCVYSSFVWFAICKGLQEAKYTPSVLQASISCISQILIPDKMRFSSVPRSAPDQIKKPAGFAIAA